MKKLFFCMLLACVLCIGAAPAIAAGVVQDNSVFRAGDAYFQLSGHKPVHLVHEYERINVWLGNDFRLWLTLEIPEGAQSPCSRRSDVSCKIAMDMVDGAGKAWEMWGEGGLDFNCEPGDSSGMSIPGHIKRKAAFGNGMIRFKLLKDKVPIYIYSIPVNIQ
jgi:hypothetical protein